MSAEHFAVRGRLASRSDTRAASQTFERMHNTLSHRVKALVPGGIAAKVGDAEFLLVRESAHHLCVCAYLCEYACVKQHESHTHTSIAACVHHCYSVGLEDTEPQHPIH